MYRARCISEYGRRAAADPALAEDLLRWAADVAMRQSKWVGTVTLAFVAAAAVGYSQRDPEVRSRLRAVLEGWDRYESGDLIFWTKKERWLEDMADIGE